MPVVYIQSLNCIELIELCSLPPNDGSFVAFVQ